MMKNRVERSIFILLFIFTFSSVFSQNCPEIYYKFGTKKNDVIFDMGSPKLIPDERNIIYESYSTNTLETLVFVFDENESLIGIIIHIAPQYNSPLPMSEYLQKIYQNYLSIFEKVYGKPTFSKGQNNYWKYDDAFVVYMPYTKEGFPYYYFMVMLKEYASERGFGFIYNDVTK